MNEIIVEVCQLYSGFDIAELWSYPRVLSHDFSGSIIDCYKVSVLVFVFR